MTVAYAIFRQPMTWLSGFMPNRYVRDLTCRSASNTRFTVVSHRHFTTKTVDASGEAISFEIEELFAISQAGRKPLKSSSINLRRDPNVIRAPPTLRWVFLTCEWLFSAFSAELSAAQPDP